VVIEQGGRQARLEAEAPPPPPDLALDGEWAFAPQGDNALVIGRWLAATEKPVVDGRGLVAEPPDAALDWVPMAPGAWSYQLPAEPDGPYPIPVWYRMEFAIDSVPPAAALIIDGFAGTEWQLFVNSVHVTAPVTRSALDSQMGTVDITPLLRTGGNRISLRLVVASPTDGLLDRIKLTGDFSLRADGAGQWAIAAPRASLRPRSWTEQGYPFYSGLARLVKRFALPEAFAGMRVFLDGGLGDDAAEVLVNGASAGVQLWPGQAIEVTDWLRPGEENEIELRVANTLANLLNGELRPSGLLTVPRLVAHTQFAFELLAASPGQEE